MTIPRKTRVIVGMSGGVDSAVAALLLLQQGYEVIGLFMQNWEEKDEDGYCAAEEDYKEAYKVCQQLDIPLHGINFSGEYRERVFNYFLAEYQAGRTPNPDILCNKEIKFKAFLEHALKLGADFIATGHYARIQEENGRFLLLKGNDANKDQSYFLYTLGQKELSKTLFPVGALTKPEVRRRAREAGLTNHARKDSTGICFIGERDFKAFLSRYLPMQPGEIRTLTEERKGRHDGLMYYTLGQRHGLKIGGPGEAWYVVAKDRQKNILYVEQGEHHPALYGLGLRAQTLHWVAGDFPPLPLACRAKTRYRQADQKCTLHCLEKDTIEVEFRSPQRAITPGQSVVFYQNDICLGGGIIAAAHAAACSPPAARRA